MLSYYVRSVIDVSLCSISLDTSGSFEKFSRASISQCGSNKEHLSNRIEWMVTKLAVENGFLISNGSGSFAFYVVVEVTDLLEEEFTLETLEI